MSVDLCRADAQCLCNAARIHQSTTGRITRLLFSMVTLTFKNITLGDFYKGLSESHKTEDLSDSLRFLQKGAFEIFWRRHRGDTNTTVLYRNIGHATSAIVPEDMGWRSVMARLKKKSVTGMIKNPVAFHQDFRFVAFVKEHELYMVLDNSALDASMKQVWRYDKEYDGFIASDKITLIEFLIAEEINIPAQSKL